MIGVGEDGQEVTAAKVRPALEEPWATVEVPAGTLAGLHDAYVVMPGRLTKAGWIGNPKRDKFFRESGRLL